METLPQLMSSYENIFNDILSIINSSNWSEQVKTAIFEQITKAVGQVRVSGKVP